MLMMNQPGGSQGGQQELASHGIHFWGHHIPLGAVGAYGWHNTASFVVFSEHPMPSLCPAAFLVHVIAGYLASVIWQSKITLFLLLPQPAKPRAPFFLPFHQIL